MDGWYTYASLLAGLLHDYSCHSRARLLLCKLWEQCATSFIQRYDLSSIRDISAWKVCYYGICQQGEKVSLVMCSVIRWCGLCITCYNLIHQHFICFFHLCPRYSLHIPKFNLFLFSWFYLFWELFFWSYVVFLYLLVHTDKVFPHVNLILFQVMEPVWL